MKTTILFLAAIFLFTWSATAQFSLSQNDFTANVFSGTQSSADSVSTSYSSAGIPSNIGPGANLAWDFTGLSYYYVDTSFALHLAYPNYSYQEFGIHPIKEPLLYFDVRSLYNILPNGILKFGEKLDGKGYSLAAATGGLTDSIIFPQQVNLYSAPYTKIYFPATYNSIWSSSFSVSTAFLLNYAAGSLTHAACTYKSYVTEKDTVIGVGTVQVNTAAGKKSDFRSVIEVKVIYQQVDSFFEGTTPFTANVLQQFGLTQGQVTSTYDYKYYRAGETTPLVDVFFADNTFSPQNITHTYVHTQRLPLYTNVPVVTSQNDIDIYPNPVVNHMFTMNVPANLSGTTYRMVNIAGREILKGSISTAGQVSINVPSTIASGIYYMQLYSNGKQISVKSVEIR
ncbi:MAG: T9SS type A sorting domain-containing protein [Flavipsychrobacter sp.]|nr:T9SS type A sorting domain-containing protein [Flavipsychrobacter sp.]